MMREVTERVNDQAGKEFGLIVVDVRLRRLNYPEEVREAVFEQIRSERETGRRGDPRRGRKPGPHDPQRRAIWNGRRSSPKPTLKPRGHRRGRGASGTDRQRSPFG